MCRRDQIPALSASSSGRTLFLVGKVSSRSFPLSGTGLVGPCGAIGTVEMVALVTRMMEEEGEFVEGVGTVDAAAVMEKS